MCVNPGFMYFLQTVKPSIAAPFAKELDTAIERILLQEVFQLSSVEQYAGDSQVLRPRVQRALDWARLPLSLDGLGVTSMEDVAPAAYFSSFMAAVTREEKLECLIAVYEDGLAQVYDKVRSQLPNVETDYLPPTSSEIDIFYNLPEKTSKLQRKISIDRARVERSLLAEKFQDPADIRAFESGEHGRLVALSSPPSSGLRNLPDSLYVPMVRARFQLPRKPQRDSVECPDTGVLVDECLACAGRVLDAHSIHAQSCSLGRTARTARHGAVNNVVCRYAKQAGFDVQREVLAAELLVQNVAPADIHRLVRGARSGEQRMDAVLKDPNKNVEIWVDTTIRHPQCPHYLGRQRGNALKEAVKLKNKTYGALLRAAKQEAEDNQRACAPVFHVAAMTTLGEFGDQFQILIEKIVKHRGGMLAAEGPRLDGKSPHRVIIDFRQNFKTDLLFAMARGNAQMITRAGRSRSFLRRNF